MLDSLERHRSGAGSNTGGNAGFSLIELLVCVAIIAILASLLVPALARARAKGNSLYCLNNVRQLTVASLVYTEDASDRLPYNMGQAEITRAAATNNFCNWTTPIMTWELDTDNTNAALVTKGGIGPYTGKAPSIYRCPSDNVLSPIQVAAGWRARVRSLSMNAMIGDAGEFSAGGENINNPEYKQFFRLSQIAKPAKIFMFIDEHPDSINDGYFLNNQESGRWLDLPASYHDGGSNLTFADGHAEHKKWVCPSTKPPSRPEGAHLPFDVPYSQWADWAWLMDRTSTEY